MHVIKMALRRHFDLRRVVMKKTSRALGAQRLLFFVPVEGLFYFFCLERLLYRGGIYWPGGRSLFRH